MYIETESHDGQGLAFNYDNQCLLVTAAHVVGSVGAMTKIVGEGGEIYGAKVIDKDPELDLALLDVLRDGESGAIGNRICRVRTSGNLQTTKAVGIADQVANKKARIGWIERVPSRSGGLENIMFDGYFNPIESGIKVIPLTEHQILSGDSGAPAWLIFSDYDGTQERYQNQLENRMRNGSSGLFLGIVSTSSIDGIQLIPADIVRDYILKALTGMKWSNIQVLPESVSVTKRARGPLPGAFGTLGSGLGILPSFGKRSLSLEIDFGIRDFPLTSIEIEYTNPTGAMDVGKARQYFPLNLMTSRFRPDETIPDREKRYKNERCSIIYPKDSTLEKRISSKGRQITSTCKLDAPKVVRAARLLVISNPADVKSIRFITSDTDNVE